MIYVGATVDPRSRMRQHASSASWWLNVDRSQTTFSEHPDAYSASDRERDLIREHQPRYNRAGVTRAYIPYRPADRRGKRPAPSERAANTLAEMRCLAAEWELRPQIIDRARAEGESWKDIADALHMTRQGVVKLHATLKEDQS